jgi:hypothetical protein
MMRAGTLFVQGKNCAISCATYTSKGKNSTGPLYPFSPTPAVIEYAKEILEAAP